MSFSPSCYIVLPWRVLGDRSLPDHLHRTYELILSLAWGQPGRRTPPVSRRELAALRGVSLRAIDAHLRELRRRELVANLPGREGRKLVLVLLGLPPAQEPTPAADGAPPCDPPPSAASPPADAGPSPTPATDGEGAPAADTPTAAGAPAAAADGRGLLEKKLVVPTDGDNHSTAFSLLLEAGVFPGIAHRLALQPWVTPEVVSAWWAHLRGNRRVRAPAGVLASVLSRPETCLPAPRPPGAEHAPPEGHGPVGDEAGADDEAGWGGEADALDDDDLGIECRSAPGAHPHWVMVEPWLDTLAELRQRLGAERVDVWLAGSVPVGHDERSLTVAVRSPIAVDWLDKRLYRDVCDALRAVTGTEYRLTFVSARPGTLRPDP